MSPHTTRSIMRLLSNSRLPRVFIQTRYEEIFRDLSNPSGVFPLREELQR